MKNFSIGKGWLPFRFLYILGVYLSCCTAFAYTPKSLISFQQQPEVISGTVTDSRGTMAGVTITVKGKGNASFSDTNGRYIITANPTDSLVYSFMGYKILTVAVGGRSQIDAFLQEDATTLQEVTVNAGYYTVKEKHRTGSISKVKATDIATQPVSNPIAAIQGRMSGVNVTQTTGLPGGGFNIQVRGLNSIRGTGNDPLYLVDGVPFASQSLGNNDLISGIMPTLASPLNSINPSDIESIEVLKDADATAIYGSRGANGVVLITTKKGKAGKAKVTVQASTTVGEVANYLKLLNTEQYLAMRREAFANDGITDLPEDAYDVNGTWDETRYTNWQKELIGGTAHINNVQLSVSGGTTETQYLMGGTWRNETTVFPGDSQYTKAAVQTSITHRSADDRFKFQFSANYSNDKNTLPDVDLTRTAYILAPNAPALYDDNGEINWESGTFENPLAYLKGTYATNTQNLIANTLISYNLGHGFELKSSLGYTDTQFAETKTRPSTMYNPIFEAGSEYSQLIVNNGSRRTWIAEPQLHYKDTWRRAEISALVGTTFQSQKQETLAIDGFGFPSNNVLNSLAAATTVTVLADDISEYRYSAVFGRLNVNWDSRYIVNLTARRDGSSRFGPSRRFANFGAVGAAWLFSNEEFLKDNSILSFGKLRTSYGITGNDQIGDYQYLDTYQVTANIYDGVTGMAPARLFNPNFGWETNKKLEAALELGFLNDRIFLTTAVFQNRSGNQLVGIPLPGTAGFPTLQANLNATVQNTGLEIDLRTVNVKSKDFNWTTGLNLAMIRNKLLAFPGLQGSTYANNFVIGESLNIRKVYHLTGTNPDTGLYTFEDYNNDGVITSAEDRQVIIDTTPEYFGGLSNQLVYKNFELDFLFQFVKQKGTDIRAAFPIPGLFSNQPATILDGTAPLYTAGGNPDATTSFEDYTRSDALVTDASYIRLKSLSLAYNIPKTLAKGITGKIYLQGQNLFTVTKYKGPDPENQSGVSLPSLRQLTLGLNLTF